MTRNYYIEQSPCLLHLIPLNILKEHLLIEGEGREALLRSIQLRTTHMQQEEMVHIFSVEGLRYLMEAGISRKLYELCRFLEEGNLTCTCGETLELIGQMIREYGGTL